MKDLDRVSKSLPHRRDIKCSDLRMLAETKLAGCVHFVIAIVKAMPCSPHEFETSGVSKLITQDDVKSMTDSSKAMVEKCSGIIAGAKDWSSCYSSHAVKKCLDDLEVRLVMQVFFSETLRDVGLVQNH